MIALVKQVFEMAEWKHEEHHKRLAKNTKPDGMTNKQWNKVLSAKESKRRVEAETVMVNASKAGV